MQRRYKIYDVFTDRPLAGNPLAIVLESDGLEGAAMQAIAREFNLSETVFVAPSRNPAHTAHVRIFTPTSELPFAGHPTVGTAVCLARERFDGPGEHDAVIVLEEGIGAVRCGVRIDGSAGFAEFDCPKLPERAGDAADKKHAATALGLDATEIGFENHVTSVWSAGIAFHFVPVRNLGVLSTAAVNRPAWNAAFGEGAAFVYTRETEGHDHSFRARLFAPTFGIEEDPATGSAAAAFAGPMHAFDDMPDGEHIAMIEQGYEMGRPSLIRLEVSIGHGAIANVRIGGDAVEVAAGLIEI